MFDLSGKKALVTGASGGIGREIAKALAAAGATVALSGTRVGALEDTASAIGKECPILPCNLSNLDEVDRLVPAAEDALGGLDILVNNAGMTRDNLFMRMKNEEWDEVLAVNLTAAFHLSRACLRGMMKRRFGRIIGISSVVGVMGNPGQGNYAASKAGLIGMSKALAHEVASRNITVNTVAPGFIGSAMTDELNEKQRQDIMSTIPAGRLGTAEEVAGCVVFLASDAAGYVTGHTLNVNGGMAMI
ncbi:beta-ketoacyl-ACP reductase [Devosia pacifica]|uniref:3-oxoacyl-[acyl-carrier-protein] reductase n=1 Tax=Devosia pacifica TaxID=1335967 RepID=A0A918VYC7_9HYPH|nr:3-oxoacyl-[acyl-carrier-protein] reductase [Devosia pacifica]GHA35289.1 beta-ketoacyl-ACP reductase [Devosia pacifica]